MILCDDCQDEVGTKYHPVHTLFGLVHICEDCWDKSPHNPDYDPTPWCSGCKSMTRSGCKCGPIAENE